MSTELAEAEERVRYWCRARDIAEAAWIDYQGPRPWHKEKLRRAYEFTDRLLLGWERRRDALRARAAGGPALRLVRSA